MQFVHRIIPRHYSSTYSSSSVAKKSNLGSIIRVLNHRLLSGKSESGGNGDGSSGKSVGGSSANDLGWDSVSSWSTGLTKDHFHGDAVGHQVAPTGPQLDSIPGSRPGSASHSQLHSQATDENSEDEWMKKAEEEFRWGKSFIAGWEEKMNEMSVQLKQVTEPGARGSYLKDSEKAEMYRLHKENPEVYTVEKLAKDYRIMRQRVHAILWLKELEEEEEKKLGRPLDDSVELLLDTCPEFFNSHDREFHVATLPYKPDFKVMPEGWDGTTRDPDEVHYEISQKEDEMLYQDFLQRMNFNKMKMRGEVKVHKYSRRRPDDGWSMTVEKLGSKGKRGGGGGWKFVSLPDGSTRPLNEKEKMYVKRETPRRRRRILP